jgi:hypothetical protein
MKAIVWLLAMSAVACGGIGTTDVLTQAVHDVHAVDAGRVTCLSELEPCGYICYSFEAGTSAADAPVGCTVIGDYDAATAPSPTYWCCDSVQP